MTGGGSSISALKSSSAAAPTWSRLRSDASMAVAYVLAAALRFWTMSWAGLEDRVEFATPVNSFRRMTEGAKLLDHGVDPYSGVVFHETPLALAAFRGLVLGRSPSGPGPEQPEGSGGFVAAEALFVGADLLAAFLLGVLASAVEDSVGRERLQGDVVAHHPDAEELLQTPEKAAGIGRQVQLAYLFHPYLIGNCSAKTTTVFSNLLLAAFLLAASRGHRYLGAALCALAAYQSVYNLSLILPLCLFVAAPGKNGVLPDFLRTAAAFCASFAALNLATYYWLTSRSWDFLRATHGFALAVPELAPNIGIYWYFFTEMFEHFRPFFVCTFQLNCFTYAFPLAFRFRNHPHLLCWTLLALGAAFKSYPCYGDVGFYMSLLPLFRPLFPYVRQTFVVANMFLAATALGPVLHRAWIYNGSANANYFFAVNMVFATAQIFLVTDLLFAQVKRDFYLKNGFKMFLPTGDRKKDLNLVMK